MIQQDELLNHFIGHWSIARQFATRSAENVASVEWVLAGHWLRITMEDVAWPSAYEAHVYITLMDDTNTYAVHWHDTFGGTLPEVLGIGIRHENSLVVSFKEADGELRNTFAWHPDSDTWTSHIEQTDADGNWKVFCTDTYRRR